MAPTNNPATAGWKNSFLREVAQRGRRQPGEQERENDGGNAADEAQDRVGEQFAGVAKVDAGMRNMGSEPQNWRATTTLEMAESTIEPRTAALQRPMTSSMTNRMAEMGALKAAASPAAAPTGAKRRSRSRERRR